jgi:hypothetical protein
MSRHNAPEMAACAGGSATRNAVQVCTMTGSIRTTAGRVRSNIRSVRRQDRFTPVKGMHRRRAAEMAARTGYVGNSTFQIASVACDAGVYVRLRRYHVAGGQPAGRMRAARERGVFVLRTTAATDNDQQDKKDKT